MVEKVAQQALHFYIPSFNRAIEFVQVFIFEVANGEENLGAAASECVIVCSISMRVLYY